MNRVLHITLAVFATGCIGFDFTDRSDVTYTRVLALQVDPPVFRAGDTVTARALVARPDGSHLDPDGTPFTNEDGERQCEGDVCFDWSFCLRPERTPGLESIQFNPEVPSQGCDAADLSVGTTANPFLATNPDGTLTVDTTFVAGMIDTGMLSTIAAALQVPETVVEQVLRDIGIAVVVELRVFDREDVFIAYKRALFIDDGCTEDCPGTNPPPPQLELRPRDDESASPSFWVTGRNVAEPFECRACTRAESESEGEPSSECLPTTETIQLPADTQYILAPEDDLVNWREPYTILSLSGEFLPTQETGFFSFFTTGGGLQEGKTRFPAAEEIFTTPSEPNNYSLWVVVRDGHYGQDACRIDFELL